MASTSAFYTSNDEDYKRKCEAQTQLARTDDDKLDAVYEIHKCVAWIEQHNFARVSNSSLMEYSLVSIFASRSFCFWNMG